MSQILVYVLAFVVGTIATGRVVRLITQDAFPPMEWIRTRWYVLVKDRWGVLVECPWCAAPYVATANGLWAYYSDLSTLWWMVNLIAAGAYLAAILVIHDEG